MLELMNVIPVYALAFFWASVSVLVAGWFLREVYQFLFD